VVAADLLRPAILHNSTHLKPHLQHQLVGHLAEVVGAGVVILAEVEAGQGQLEALLVVEDSTEHPL